MECHISEGGGGGGGVAVQHRLIPCDVLFIFYLFIIIIICNNDIEILKIQKHTKREREQKKVNGNYLHQHT